MNSLGAIIFLAAVFLFATFLNWYVFQAVKTLSLTLAAEKQRTIVSVAYWLIFQGLAVWLVLTFLKVFRMGEITAEIQTVMNVFLTIMVTQLVCVIFLFGEDIINSVRNLIYFHLQLVNVLMQTYLYYFFHIGKFQFGA